jgi:hypothetical protein
MSKNKIRKFQNSNSESKKARGPTYYDLKRIIKKIRTLYFSDRLHISVFLLLFVGIVQSGKVADYRLKDRGSNIDRGRDISLHN